MKPRRSTSIRRRVVRLNPRGAGGDAANAPPWGWRGGGVILQFANPRAPSVPTTLDLRLDEYFAAAAVIGLIASQVHEPNQDWLTDWSFRMGEKMAATAMRRRRRAKRE